MVRLEGDDRVAVLTLSRPDRRNALSASMLGELAAAVAEVAARPELRSVALIADGAAFSVGADVIELAEHASAGSLHERVLANVDLMSPAVAAIASLVVPTVAGLQGPVVGAGLALALACDIRIAHPESRFVPGFVGVGIPPDSGASWLLARTVGPGLARDILLRNRTIGGPEALAMGLVGELADDPTSRAVALAQELAGGPPRTLAATKRLLSRPSGEALDERLEAERSELDQALATGEPAEGVIAFVERRSPTWGT